jgi:hypothetical protein
VRALTESASEFPEFTEAALQTTQPLEGCGATPLRASSPRIHESVGMRVRVEARTSRCECGCGAACEDLTKGSLCLGEIGGCTAGRPARFNTKARA